MQLAIRLNVNVNRTLELLSEVEKRLKGAMPHKFQNSRQGEPSAVRGGEPKGGLSLMVKDYVIYLQRLAEYR